MPNREAKEELPDPDTEYGQIVRLIRDLDFILTSAKHCRDNHPIVMDMGQVRGLRTYLGKVDIASLKREGHNA